MKSIQINEQAKAGRCCFLHPLNIFFCSFKACDLILGQNIQSHLCKSDIFPKVRYDELNCNKFNSLVSGEWEPVWSSFFPVSPSVVYKFLPLLIPAMNMQPSFYSPQHLTTSQPGEMIILTMMVMVIVMILTMAKMVMMMMRICNLSVYVGHHGCETLGGGDVSAMLWGGF